MMKMKKPELLSPAGDWEKLQMAVLYGADAVYLAGTSFGMRSFAGNFDDEALPKAVRFAHDHGVDLEWCEPGGKGGVDAGQHISQPVTAGDPGEVLGIQGVHGHIDAP